MTAPAAVWIALGLTTTVAIIAVLIALVRHALLLGRTLHRFQEEVQPIADEIAAEGERASSRRSWRGPRRPSGPFGPS
ncbi:MAG: hypothetical protein ACRDHS_15320 [Actinomycetota bacterium]